jgi:ribosome-binding protein aMBF1 (putative translation factor)
MSAHTKARHTRASSYIKVTIGLPGNKKLIYKIPNANNSKTKLADLLETLQESEEDITTPLRRSSPWEKVAADRIEKYKKAGLVLRGARYREGISQKELATKSGVSQDNISRIENGKRVVGEKIAKKLSKPLKIDYRLLLE